MSNAVWYASLAEPTNMDGGSVVNFVGDGIWTSESCGVFSEVDRMENHAIPPNTTTAPNTSQTIFDVDLDGVCCFVFKRSP